MKKKLLIVGLISALMVGGLVLMGCEEDSSGGCPNKTCFYNSDSNWSFCNQTSCGLAYDYDAKCNCK